MEYRYRDASEMKDSGVEWIGKIPTDWTVSRMKYVSTITNGQVDPTQKPYSHMPHIGPENIEKFSGRLLKYRLAYEENLTSGKYYFEPNDILYGKINPQLGKSCIVDFIGICSADMYPIKSIKGKIISKYLIYYMLSNKFLNQSISFPARAGIPKINREELMSIFVNVPKIKEQEKIANFLDKKTSQFDSIISKKEALIEKLEEAKKSLISEVVTGKVKVVKTDDGYDLVKRNSDEMKDSGVEWLDEIPNDWEVKAIKYLFKLRNERNFKEMDEVQLLSLFTSLGVMKQGEVEARGNKVRTVEDYKEVYPNDIVVNIILAWMGAIGMSEHRGVISPAYDIYKPINSNVVSKYYHYLFRTTRFSGECYKKGRGIMDMRWRTYSDEFKSIIVTSPTVDEKNDIVKYLDGKINNIDNLIQKTQKHIEKLKEAKQSLISEAVTGKIEILD